MNEPSEFDHSGTLTVTVDNQQYPAPHACPNRDGWLVHGTINEQRKSITCPLHFSVFSLETGEQLSGPPGVRVDVKGMA